MVHTVSPGLGSESFDSVDLGPGKLRESFWLK